MSGSKLFSVDIRIITSSCMIGNDRVGWLYISQLAYAARELSQKHRTPPKDADKNILRKARAIEHTLWGVFNLTA